MTSKPTLMMIKIIISYNNVLFIYLFSASTCAIKTNQEDTRHCGNNTIVPSRLPESLTTDGEGKTNCPFRQRTSFKLESLAITVGDNLLPWPTILLYTIIFTTCLVYSFSGFFFFFSPSLNTTSRLTRRKTGKISTNNYLRIPKYVNWKKNFFDK